MFTRFTYIINGLKSLGRTYSNADLVQKILRSLPDKWDPKVTFIQEAKDLNTLPLDELMGSLIIHKLAMQHRTDNDQKKKKTITFKAALEMSKLEEESEDDYSSDDDIEDEDIAMVIRRFRKFMRKKKKRYFRKFHRKGEYNKDKDK